MKIIGICGYAGSGKDTLADMIMKRLPGSRRASFADPMRAMLSALGVPDLWMVDRELKEKSIPGLGRSYRQLAQTLGTEWGRVCHGEDFWVRALANRLEREGGKYALIPDVRFPNEAQWVLDSGGKMIRVVRPNAQPVNPHESEQYVPTLPVNFEVYNTGTLADLSFEADTICKVV